MLVHCVCDKGPEQKEGAQVAAVQGVVQEIDDGVGHGGESEGGWTLHGKAWLLRKACGCWGTGMQRREWGTQDREGGNAVGLVGARSGTFPAKTAVNIFINTFSSFLCVCVIRLVRT